MFAPILVTNGRDFPRTGQIPLPRLRANLLQIAIQRLDVYMHLSSVSYQVELVEFDHQQDATTCRPPGVGSNGIWEIIVFG